jgi:hypothetical protein
MEECKLGSNVEVQHVERQNVKITELPWRRGLQNRRSLVRVPPGCKVFRPLHIAVLLSKVKSFSPDF